MCMCASFRRSPPRVSAIITAAAGFRHNMVAWVRRTRVVSSLAATRHGARRLRPCLLALDEAVDHHARIAVADAPEIAQRAAFGAEAEPFGEPHRRRVVGMNQGLDAVHLERSE